MITEMDKIKTVALGGDQQLGAFVAEGKIDILKDYSQYINRAID